MELGLKVDVCTYAGMRHGVPALLEIFGDLGIKASFFVACGPDHSGRAIRRIFRRGFFEKMRRTNAVGTYGLKTVLYGTLLPGPHVARSCASLMRDVVAAGHELALHGYSHVYWQDNIGSIGTDAVREELRRACDAFASATGRAPRAFGAPGWQCSPASFECEDELGLLYHSDTRGHAPYRPRWGEKTFRTLEIPTTLPTLDETWGRVGTDERALARWYTDRLRDGLNVYTAHAEMEGRQQLSWFKGWLHDLRGRLPIRRLEDIAAEYADAGPSRCFDGPIEGRAGTVAWQEEPS